MKTWLNRVWGLHVGWLELDPPVEVAGRGEPAPLADEDRVLIVERLDVPPETAPWDVAREPAVAPDGPAGVSPAPHCNGRHGEAMDQIDGRRCEYCDVLTDLITEHKALVKRVAELERDAEQRAEYDREMKERQS